LFGFLLKYPPLSIPKWRAAAHTLITTAAVFPADAAKCMLEADLCAAVCFPAMLALKDNGKSLFGMVKA
jgi:hypothetical protein